jgi:hypothetical protein
MGFMEKSGWRTEEEEKSSLVKRPMARGEELEREHGDVFGVAGLAWFLAARKPHVLSVHLVVLCLFFLPDSTFSLSRMPVKLTSTHMPDRLNQHPDAALD